MVVSNPLTDYPSEPYSLDQNSLDHNALRDDSLEQYSLDPLLLDIQGRAASAQPGGHPLERIVTLYNRGDQTAEVILEIVPVDLRSEPLKKWITIQYPTPELILQPQERIDVTLLITVPPETDSGFYSYDVCVHSEQYSNLQTRKSQQLQITGDELSGLPGQEPDFTLSPATSPDAPYSLTAGEPLTLVATVQNQSRRTDRYFLSLLDVPTDWFSVEYPENNANLPGLITRTDGLQLNPGESGDLILRIHPPPYTPAGDYFPTVQLSGSNRDEIVLLEVAYLSIPVDDKLHIALTPDHQLVPPQRAYFDITVHNTGNIHRNLCLAGQDQSNAFTFKLTSDVLSLAPNQTAIVEMTARPKRWLSRLCNRRRQTVPLDLIVENDVVDQLEGAHQLAPVLSPALPAALPKGFLHWQPYRRWLFWLVLSTSVVGTLSLVSWLAWYFFVWRPNLRPQVLMFAPTSDSLQADGDEPAAFNWDISNPASVGSIQLNWEGAEEPVTYAFPRDTEDEAVKVFPSELASYCQLTETVDQRVGSFVAPLLRFHRRRRTGTENLQVLQCSDLPLNSFSLQAGEYDFTLKTFSDVDGQGLRDVGKLEEMLTVAPPPPPTVTELIPGATAYRQDSNGRLQPVALAQGVSTGSNQTSATVDSIPVSWQVTNTQRLKALRLGSLAADGNQNLQEQVFDFSEGLPAALEPYCQMANHSLTCVNVPTLARSQNDYNFYVQAISLDAQVQGENAIAQTPTLAPTVTVSPPPPEIAAFTINGQSVINSPKQIIRMQPNQKPFNITLSWDVKNATQVEVLPAPGLVNVNSITYPVSPTPGSETIVLRAVNAAGEEVTTSIVIEVVVNEQSLPKQQQSNPPQPPRSSSPQTPRSSPPQLERLLRGIGS